MDVKPHIVKNILTEQWGGHFSSPLSELSFEYLRSYFEKMMKKKRKAGGYIQLGNNTWLHEISKYEMAIKFHSTDIIKVDVTDTIRIYTNGWIGNNITRGRLNAFLPGRYHVTSNDGEYCICIGNWFGDCYPFYEGIRILPNGDIV